MRTTWLQTTGFLCVLAVSTPGLGQTAGGPERPIPQFQFGSTANFSGFQFQQSQFGSPVGTPIAFPGIQFPGFGSRYDVTSDRTAPVPSPAVASPRIGNAFDPRFAPRGNAASGRSPRWWLRSDRSDPFGGGSPSGMSRARELLERNRQPFVGTDPSQSVEDGRPRLARSPAANRLAREDNPRHGRRRPFFDQVATSAGTR